MELTSAVLDAGPIIHLAELSALDVLDDLEFLYVSDFVWSEIRSYQPSALIHSKIERTAVPAPSVELHTLAQALDLDRGELEALCLMQAHPEFLFLTDDAAARLAATQLGYQVHGTIGLLIRSVRQRRRKPEDVFAMIASIPDRSTLFVAASLLKAILENLEREWFRKS